ncbi:MAG: 50S ribosomal protein L4 [Clostridiales bacterium]|jgi:large subunit ribosomal protein L4|nr:50S ribosomal protein L4 [Clostridiales bacterium]
MPTVGLFNQEGKQVGDIQLNENVFGVEVNADAIHQVVVALLANKRQGTQSAKTRAEVRGGGAKPWRQKGTGRARQGSIRAPQWIKGGIVFAPKPRNYRVSVPKSMRKVAMKSALTSKVQDGQMVVLESLALEAPKTKDMVQILKAFEAKKTLIVTAEANEVLYKSARNIAGVEIIPANNINVYDLLKTEKLIITKDAVSKIEEVYA